MSEWQMALLIGAIFTAGVAYKLPRSWLWIGAGAASFVLSTAYYRFGYPYYPIATLAFDGCVCLAIYGIAKERWEIGLFRLFQASVLVSLVYTYLLFFSRASAHHTLYVMLLEAINWLALCLIGGTAVADRMRANEGGHIRNWLHSFHWNFVSLRKARKSIPWHKVAR